MSTFLNILLVILVILAIAFVILYFVGRKLEKQQYESQQAMEMAKQTISMLVIDKKRMKIRDAVAAGLPEAVYQQTPWYLKWAKLPVVKAKVGPKVLAMVADEGVFAVLPVKKECKVVVSGIYICEIKSVRGGTIPKTPKKKGFFANIASRFRKEKDEKHK
ncbi:MAG: hypothetical protein LUC94_02900 [Clostridiales bacterium]|nr:hypothetical protein [Clostridiales bacterium]